MDQTLLTAMLQGGGLLAFTIAVWFGQREIARTLAETKKEQAELLGDIKVSLAKLEERSEAADRRLAATPPFGVPTVGPRRRRPPDTEED